MPGTSELGHANTQTSPAPFLLRSALLAAAIVFTAWSGWLIYSIDQRQNRFEAELQHQSELQELRAALLKMEAMPDAQRWVASCQDCLHRISHLRAGAIAAVEAFLREAGRNLEEAARLSAQPSQGHDVPPASRAATRTAADFVDRAGQVSQARVERASAAVRMGWTAAQAQILVALLLGLGGIFLPGLVFRQRLAPAFAANDNAALAAAGADAAVLVPEDKDALSNATEATRPSETASRIGPEFFRQTLTNLGVPVLVFDASGVPVFLNAAFEQISGYKSDDVNNRPFWEVICPPEVREETKCAFEEALRQSGPCGSACEMLNRAGVRQRVNRVTVSLRDESGRPVFLVATLQEGGAEPAHPQNVQSQKMEAIGRLASGLAHDFNNIITAITGYSDLVMESLEPSDPLRADVGEIVKASERAAALTRQLMEFSKAQVIQPRPVNLNRVLLDMTNMLQRLLGVTHPIETQFAEGLWLVKADPGQLERVVVNLAVNARDAMPGGGTLRVRTVNMRLGVAKRQLAPGDYVVLSVADSGIGMSPEVQEHIFEPFFSTKTGGYGTGLGLATVYAIVNQFHGLIEVESAPNQGATFRIYFPRLVAAEPAPDVKPVVQAPIGGSETVLVLEDEDEVRGVICRVLQNNGYTVLAAGDATEAQARFDSQGDSIDLLVSDIVLPGENGTDVATRFRQSAPHLRVLFVSGYPAGAKVTESPGRTAVLQKPFTADALLNRIRKLLDAESSGTRASAAARRSDSNALNS